jgi:hypothetical protein
VGTEQADSRKAEHVRPRAGRARSDVSYRYCAKAPASPARSTRAHDRAQRGCELQLSSGLVSRRHARLTLSHLGVTVEDLGSRNGVYVNSVRVIGSVRLKPGDRLAVGTRC